jgi:hypothetical protein
MPNAIDSNTIASFVVIVPLTNETTPNGSIGATLGQQYTPIKAIPTAATTAILNLIGHVNSIYLSVGFIRR